ncbi:type IV secretion system DNA-binding domain-containing protein [Martelella mangrovi]|uniref:Type IV secretion system coupling protein TraD DNA-binding domain-containing protein n=1 Tax=Martelella mangrovi TaxID=1397477 RepID=A0ABV2ID16_9HYPH
MITKPRRSELSVLFYAGLFFVAVAAVTWVYLFVVKSWSLPEGFAVRLSVSEAIDCLKIWNGDLCSRHFVNSAGTPPAGLKNWQWLVVGSLIAGITGIAVGGYFTFLQPPEKWIKSGRTVAGMPELLSAAKREKIDKKDGLHWFNGWRLALEREVRHFIIFGSIGGGKTQTMIGLIVSAIARHDKVLVFDIKGDFTEKLPPTIKPDGSKVQPIIIAPQDRRSHVWDIAKDLRIAEDAVELATRLIPDTRDRFFSNSARAVLAACTIRLMHEKPRAWTWADLVAETRRDHLELLEVAHRYHPDAVRFLDADYRQVSSTLSTLTADTNTLRLLATAWSDYEGLNRFSLRDWLLYKTEKRTVILQKSGRFSDQSDGWISAFLTIASGIVSDPELGDAKLRRIWFFVDEFAQLPKISRFSALLDIGRSKGVCVCLGVQDIAQIRDTYGRERADAWMSIVGTKIIAKVNSGPTAQRLESDVGQATVVYNRREPRANGLEWVRDERRENTIERSEFETQLGPRKNGIDVLVTGIGEDVYKVRVPYTTLPHARDAQEPAHWTLDLITVSRLEGTAASADDADETGNANSDDGYPKEAIEVLKGMEPVSKPRNTSMVEGETLDLFDGQLPGI